MSSRSYHGSDGELRGAEPVAPVGVGWRYVPHQAGARWRLSSAPSGAGKTSIAALVPRLYDVTHGSVSIDGVDVRRIRLADLAAAVGFVTQESFLLQTTIEDNLRYAKPNATRDEVVAAAKARLYPRPHNGAAGRVRHPGRRAGIRAVYRRAAAALHRQDTAARAAHPDSRRSHLGAGHGQRADAASGADAAGAGAAPRWSSPTGCPPSWPPTLSL